MMPQFEITEEAYAFILHEFGLGKAQLVDLDQDSWEKLFEDLQEIELAELKDDGITERGRLAADVCDMIWNPGKSPEGIAEYEKEMAEDDVEQELSSETPRRRR